MQIVQLGSKQQLEKVNTNELNVLCTSDSHKNSMSSLSLVLDSDRTLSARIKTLYQVRLLLTNAAAPICKVIDD